MGLVDDATVKVIQARIKPIKSSAGGSAANSVYILSQLGVKSMFIGEASDDEYGKSFVRSLQKSGVEVHINHDPEDEATGVSFILITPDGDRTMLTHIGSSDNIRENDMNYEALKDTKLFFTQAYMLDNGEKSQIVRKSFDLVHESGGLNAFALSAAFKVSDHRDEIMSLMDGIDLMFANTDEIKALFDVSDVNLAINNLQQFENKVFVVTLGKDGAMIVTAQDVIRVPVWNKKTKIVDATGAGDSFAAGFMYGFLNKKSLQECAIIGSKAADVTIQHIGARPKYDFGKLR